MTEDEPVREIEVTPAPEMETPASAEPVLTDKIIDTMKVKDLRDDLSKCGVKQGWTEGRFGSKNEGSCSNWSSHDGKSTFSPALLTPHISDSN